LRGLTSATPNVQPDSPSNQGDPEIADAVSFFLLTLTSYAFFRGFHLFI
jgi:hypothetical protein